MPRRGREFEQLVALIERAIHQVDGVHVSSPAMLPDRDTGALREIDVLLEFRHAHLDFKVAIECRQWTTKIGTPAVEAFWSKCLTTGVNQGIIVSNSGFTAGARKKAAACNIRCLTLADAEKWDWCACGGVDVRHPKLLDGQVICKAADPILEPYRIFRPDGVEFTGEDAARIGAQKLDKIIPPDLRGGPYQHTICFGPQPGYVIGADGRRQDILGIEFHVLFQVVMSYAPFRCLSYSDEEGQFLRASAVADLDMGDMSGQMLLLEQASGDVEITFWPRRDMRVNLMAQD